MNPFIVHIDQIAEVAQPWEADLSREFLDEVLAAPPPSEFRADGAAHLNANLTKLGRDVLVRGRATVPLKGQCKRCLKPLHVDEPVEFTLTFVPAEAAPHVKSKDDEPEAKGGKKKHKRADDESPEASFDLGKLDDERYSGKEIDLAQPLREQVLLNLPPSPVCKEDCKGLCVICGGDLNERDCGHKQESADPRWQALKNIQLDKKKE